MVAIKIKNNLREFLRNSPERGALGAIKNRLIFVCPQRTKPQNRRFSVQKPKNRPKNGQNRKSQPPPLQTRNTLAGLIFIYKMAIRIFVQAFAHLSTLPFTT